MRVLGRRERKYGVGKSALRSIFRRVRRWRTLAGRIWCNIGIPRPSKKEMNLTAAICCSYFLVLTQSARVPSVLLAVMHWRR
jgi:hypothetical protein